jgi:hypothetical protein
MQKETLPESKKILIKPHDISERENKKSFLLTREVLNTFPIVALFF